MAVNDVLNKYGGSTVNDLNELLNHINDDDPVNVISYPSSKYVDLDGLHEFLVNCNDFTILCLNIQSLNAKFEEFRIMVEFLSSHGHVFGAICLQETWLRDGDGTIRFELEGYNFISKSGTCSAHGGLAIYLNDKYNYIEKSPVGVSDMWEYQILEIYGHTLEYSIHIANIYRPPRSNNSNQVLRRFIDEYTLLLEFFTGFRSTCAILGDFNINLLELGDRNLYNDFFDLMVGRSFFPHITLPTRFSRKRCTLLDQIYVKQHLTDISNSSAILFSNLSDHLACISTIKTESKFVQNNRYITKRKVDHASLSNFIHSMSAIGSMNFSYLLETDPNYNYDPIDSLAQDKLDEHMPLQSFRFNKYKHKRQPWMTGEILHSIKYRDKLYHKLKCCSNPVHYEALSINLKNL